MLLKAYKNAASLAELAFTGAVFLPAYSPPSKYTLYIHVLLA